MPVKRLATLLVQARLTSKSSSSMTSRKKIAAITKAARKWSCAVYFKTGVSPGVIIGECDGGKQDLKEWVGSVKVGLSLLPVLSPLSHCPIQQDIFPWTVQENAVSGSQLT